LLLAGLMASCLGSEEEYEYVVSTDAELLGFMISHDSVPELATLTFTIDQERNLIYNHDSLPHNTVIPDSCKAIVTYVSGSGSENNVLDITNLAEGDSTWIASGDSLDITKPLKLKVYAPDQATTKVYTFQVNIHTLNPDSIRYDKIASDLSFLQTDETKTIAYSGKFFTYSKIENQLQLYSSSNAVDWQAETLSGLPGNTVIKDILPTNNQVFAYTNNGDLYTTNDANANLWRKINTEYPVVSILGFLEAGDNQTEGLSTIVDKQGTKVFAFTGDATEWLYGEAVPDNFPIHDFSSCSRIQLKIGRITNVGGISGNGTVQNAAWSTQNGLYWAKLTGERYSFPPMTGANAFFYNNELWLLNGKLTDDTFNEEIYYSIDGGTTWQTKSLSVFLLPTEYEPRYFSSVVTDSENKYFYIIGGTQSGFLPEIWKGCLNKVEFAY
jgi:hypothetical protein